MRASTVLCSQMSIFAESPIKLRRAAQSRGQFLACREAAADIEEFQQVDDGGPPVSLLRVRRCALLQLRHDINEGDRPGRSVARSDTFWGSYSSA